MNKIILLGHVGHDPEMRTTRDGLRFAKFSLATSERWKDSGGEQQERTQWHRITVWNEGLARVVEAYVKKGSKVYVEGTLRANKWTGRDNAEHHDFEVHLETGRGEICLCDRAGDRPGDRGDGDFGRQSYGRPANDDRTSPSGRFNPPDDDIPF